MEKIIFLTIIFLAGLIFGSFASVLVDRWKNGKSGIMTGRSECPKCLHTLGFFDLFPLFSYIFLGGKCRYCKEKISPIYPLLEFIMGSVFVASTYFLINFEKLVMFDSQEFIKLGFFLFISFVTVVFVFYDIRFTEIPDEIMIPSITILTGLLIYSFFSGNLGFLFTHYETLEINSNLLFNATLGGLIIYTFFYLQILIPGIFYCIREKKYKLIIELFLYYIFFPAIIFVDYIKNMLKIKKTEAKKGNEEEIEMPAWIGWGDLRIAIFAGLVGGTKKALLGLVLAYIIGSIIGIFVLAKKYSTKDKNVGSEIAFGPFLGIGLLVSLYFYQDIMKLYFDILLP